MNPFNGGRLDLDLRTRGSGGARLYWPDGQEAYQQEGCRQTPERADASAAAVAAALAQAGRVKPVDSMEARWILPGALDSAVRDWFERFPAETETREDTYLVFPPLDGLSLKYRGGRTLEVKCQLGSHGLLGLPVRGLGRLESWRKWSFAGDLLSPVDRPASAWVTVRKFRRSIWFPLPASQTQEAQTQEAQRQGARTEGAESSPADTGCTAELAEADVDGRPIWTIGLEATGSAERRVDAVQHAVRRLFASPLPAKARFGLGNSWSYTHWLYRHPHWHRDKKTVG